MNEDTCKTNGLDDLLPNLYILEELTALHLGVAHTRVWTQEWPVISAWFQNSQRLHLPALQT